jgi:hypothetical protein
MKDATQFEVVQQTFDGGNHVTRIANARVKPEAGLRVSGPTDERSPQASESRRLGAPSGPNGAIQFVYLDAAILAISVLILDVGLVRAGV